MSEQVTVRRAQRGASRLVAAGAAVTLLASACGGPTSGWRFEGSAVTEVEDSLTTMEAGWRDQLANSGVEVAIPEDAGCYLQVVDEEMIADQVLCGPFASMGATQTQWAVAPLSAMHTADQEVRLVLDDETAFTLGTPNPNAVPTDAAGNPADVDQEVEPPTAPPVEVGTVIPLTAADTEEEPTTYDLVTPDATYRISTYGVTSAVGDPTDPSGAPEGGSLVTVGVERQAAAGAPTSPTSSAVVRTGDTELEAPEDLSAVAVAGDGGDAVVAVEYDGNLQEFDLATGEPVSGRPYTTTLLAPVNAPERERLGEETDGESTAYEFRLHAGTASWDEERGWAPEGTDRLYLDLSLDAESQFSGESDGGSRHAVSYLDRSFEVTALTVTADGQEVTVDLEEAQLGEKADDDYENLEMLTRLVLEVPAGTEEVTVSATVEISSTIAGDELSAYERDYVQGEPETITASLELAEVTLTPQG